MTYEEQVYYRIQMAKALYDVQTRRENAWSAYLDNVRNGDGKMKRPYGDNPFNKYR